MEPLLLTADEVAKLVRISRRKFDALYLNGDAPACIRIGRQRFWKPCDVLDWLNALREERPIPQGVSPAER
ncbi:hypothetical protein DSC91_005405 [Paraburkholderia caffeinilytica]|nr:hypothetical protein DSC91_005405 [Paraburkholderia caffeinilytica]CAB3794343.1 hypothetical protein LMG28690_03910 [Paraburkholderia caffeinilytica]